MESVTVQRPAPGYAGFISRVRSLPADTLAIWAFGALCVFALAGFFARVTYPNYDSYYALLWGREIMHFHLPSFEAYRAPTEHPLWVAYGGFLSLFGEGADRLLVLSTMFGFVALAAGTYRLGRLCFTPLVGIVATLLLGTRFDFPSLAVRGYIDIPFMATIVWAAALEVARPRRGVPVFLLLAAAGLMRPEAWLLSGAYFLWMSWDATWAERRRYALLTAIAPALWVATDFVVTGNPLFSLTSTKDLAAELQRTKSGTGVISTLPGYLRLTVKTPVLIGGLIGLAIAVWRYPVRSVIPLILFLTGTFTFVATGLAGLSVIVRYLLVPSVMMSLFAAFALGGFTMMPSGSRGRRLWAIGSAVAVLLGFVYTALNAPSFTRFNTELVFRGDAGRSLHALLAKPVVKEGLRCGPVSVPTHKLIPDTRWILNLPKGKVVSRSDPSPRARRKVQYGVALYPTGRTNILRTGFAVSTDAITQVPSPSFHRIAYDRYFAAYLRCPPGRA